MRLPIRTATTLTALLLCLASPGRAGDDEAHQFCQVTHARVMALLYDAACIDPATRGEDRPRRQALVARQKELNAWFSARGRRVSQADCATPEDQANFQDLRHVLANAGLLQLPLRERLEALDRMDAYLLALDRGFAGSLAALGIDLADPGDPLTAHLLGRLRIPLSFEARFFGRDESSRIGSMYFPPSNLVLLNLDILCEAPEELTDSLEHELWHHLLPIPPGKGFADNLWWEGFNEAISETWAAALRQGEGAGREWSRTVEYPVDTALACLFLGTDRAGALRYVAGVDSAETLAAGLAIRGPLGERLAGIIRDPAALDDARRERIEQLLHDWRWKEDDGSRIRIARLMANGRLDRSAVETAFVQRRKFLMDTIQALAVVSLQDIAADRAAHEAAGSLPLPPHLRRNVKAVFDYCREPYYQMSNR